ncbi:hypothetical protein FJ420_21305 [Mesorhizobium sp. B3-1-3]|uniref:hypothetical protein n=1 Tax=unclassified Mesorhizobium TaxID=325217 RepID=UPI0011276532|nr:MULTISPECIES: hypothetical protein [unclassified Mesorhizobium]TPI59862.1 hypothetical protein FJ424_24770 [Mesorhizobium sp. B3-1-8]TPI68226.1 hypothetical protein FJ420_21305 [Mesorhizobium sp. B3-1-3]
MKKPFPFKAASQLTVVPKEPRGRQQRNPGDNGAIPQHAHPAAMKRLASTPPANEHRGSPVARLPEATVQVAKASTSHELLTFIGHTESCAALRRAGLISSCDCQINPVEDPAITIALMVQSARISLAQGSPIPPMFIELLARRVEEGDAACMMVAEWLDAIGLAQVKPLPARRRRTR